MHIFVDSSVNHKKNKAVGCYVVVNDLSIDLKQIRENIQFITLESNSSTAAELEIVKYIFSIIVSNGTHPIYLYTDCQQVAHLSTKKGYSHHHKNKDIYEEILYYLDKLNITVIKVKGHVKKDLQDDKKQQIFSLVDKAARKKVREEIIYNNHLENM